MNRIISMISRCRPYFPDSEDLHKIFRSINRAKILLFLIEVGPSTIVKIWEYLETDQATVYRVIHELEDMGLVKIIATTRGSNGYMKKIWAVNYG